MTRPRELGVLPSGFCKPRFLLLLNSEINKVRNLQTAVSPPARLYLEILAEACLTHCEQLREEVRRWTYELIMTALVEIEPDSLERFRNRLEQEAGWWRAVRWSWPFHYTQVHWHHKSL